MGELPGFLEEKLKNQYGADGFGKILDGFCARRPVTLRVNPLKTDKQSVCSVLCAAGIRFREVSWYGDALILEDVREDRIRELEETVRQLREELTRRAACIFRAFLRCCRLCF